MSKVHKEVGQMLIRDESLQVDTVVNLMDHDVVDQGKRLALLRAKYLNGPVAQFVFQIKC